MTTPAAPLPRADRPLYFSGQLLTAEDLSADQEVGAGLRQLHHRMLHGWGIASGLAVTGSRGDVAVSVGWGYALDSTGQELVLPEVRTHPVPPVAAGPDGAARPYVLALRMTTVEEARVVDRPGACGTEGAVRRSDDPVLEWLDPAGVATGYDIVLAEVAVRDCRLASSPDGSGRRLLNPPPTPYVAAGRTEPGNTRWVAVAPNGVGPWAVATTVESAEAGFGDTPCYLASLKGRRNLTAAESPTGGPALLDGSPYVEAAEPGRFRVVVPLLPATVTSGGLMLPVNPASVVTGPALIGLVTQVLDWSVEWIGVQS
jgi:hypothetical protein